VKFSKKIDLSKNINLIHLSFKTNFYQKFHIPLNVKSLIMNYSDNQYIIDNLHNKKNTKKS
jgi:hypothetical protein